MLPKRYKKYITDTGWIVGVNLLRQAFQLAFFTLLVRELSKSVLGEYQFATSVVNFCALFALPGLASAVTQSVGRNYLGTFRKALKLQILGSVLGAVTIVSFALFAGPKPEGLQTGLIVAGLIFPLAYGLTSWAAYQAGRGEFRRNAAWESTLTLASYGVMILLVLYIDISAGWLIIFPYIIKSVTNVIFVWLIWRKIPSEAKSEDGVIPYGLETSLYSVANKAGNYADRFLIFYFLSPESLATFVVAEKIPEIFKAYIQKARQVLIPNFSKKKKYSAALNRKVNLVSIGISTAIALIALFIIPWIVPFLFTESYSESVLYCQLLMGTLILGQIAQTRKVFIISRLDATALRNITLGSNLIRILASVSLVPFFGIFGAVASTALYRLSTTVLVTIQMRKYRSDDEKSSTKDPKNNEENS